jgi:hypothetical protein
MNNTVTQAEGLSKLNAASHWSKPGHELEPNLPDHAYEQNSIFSDRETILHDNRRRAK